MVCAGHMGASHSLVLCLAKYPIVISWCWFYGHDMDTSSGVLSGTVDRFKMNGYTCDLFPGALLTHVLPNQVEIFSFIVHKQIVGPSKVIYCDCSPHA
ncbi:unnamed protein product [Musa banksii]